VWQSFAKIGPGTSKNLVGKKIKHGQNRVTVFDPLSLEPYAGDCKKVDVFWHTLYILSLSAVLRDRLLQRMLSLRFVGG